ncbi:MAG: alkaline phosphatase family protein [Actinomycetota bacterium]|nr:alkaline phosphatase family protein [Actinomycetota bacterium]
MSKPRRLLVAGLLVIAVAGAAFVVARDQDDPLASSDLFLRRACEVPANWIRYIERGWEAQPRRDTDLALIPEEGNWFGSFETTSHSGPYDFLQEVPLVFYGPGFVRPLGSVDSNGETTLADVAPTQAHLLDFDLGATDGRILDDVLVPREAPPKLLVTVVVDGGGWNVLRRWPNAWPNIARLMDEGASIRDAVVGSTPSITPAVHTTLATGAFPRRHGVMAIVMRRDDGSIGGAFAQMARLQSGEFADPTATLDAATLADQWDLATDNSAKVAMLAPQNYELGFVGHGAALPGGDKDIAVMLAEDESSWATNPRYFALPTYVNNGVRGPIEDLERLDAADGKHDGLWRGHDIYRIDASPAFAPWESRVIEALVTREGMGDDEVSDLLYVNFKSPDAAGHKWNMIAPEQRDVLVSVDIAIGRLVDFLDEEVGNRNYVLALTADHGQTPLDTGGWPVFNGELKSDIDKRFDHLDNGSSIVERTSTALYFLNHQEAAANGVTAEEVASWISNYRVSDNVPGGRALLQKYEGSSNDPVFAAVIPGGRIDDVVSCSSRPGRTMGEVSAQS